MSDSICTVTDCQRPVQAKTWCQMHYQRMHFTGSFDLKPRPSVDERFWAKVDKSGECWIWTAYITSTTGYGFWSYGGRANMVKTTAHRYAYETLVGPVPEGLELDHLCRVRACCNPAHLEPVTRRTNQLRGQTVGARNASVTKCPQGHAYDAENTYIYPPKGSRHCRECSRENRRRWGAAKRVAAK